MSSQIHNEHLKQVVLDIEFIIISVIQGVALTFLGESTFHIIENHQVEYGFYIGIGFLFILLFWSGAIIHALSFVDWPPDLGRNFLYFLASFVEILVFTQLNNPLGWFCMSFVFFIVAGMLYYYDLTVIKRSGGKFASNNEKILYKHILKQQNFEFKILIPAGLAFSGISALLINSNKNLFLTNHYHLLLSILQLVFSLGLIFNSYQSFKKRAVLISNSTKEDSIL